jgi:hypothetical protein
MAIDILQRIRERSYQIWEQEGRPEGRHLDHWLQAEHELVAENALDFEFKQLMRAFWRSGRYPAASGFRAGWATLSTEVKIYMFERHSIGDGGASVERAT